MQFLSAKIKIRDAIFKNVRLRRFLSIQMRFAWPAAGEKFWGSGGFELLPPLFFPDLKQGGNNSRSIGRRPENLGVLAIGLP